MKKINTQEDWINRAKEVLPAAGFGNFENDIIIKRGKGSKVWDEDNNEYIDYLIGSGPMLLGHGHPEVMEAIFEQLPKLSMGILMIINLFVIFITIVKRPPLNCDFQAKDK